MNEYQVQLTLTVKTDETDGLDQLSPEAVKDALVEWLSEGCAFEVSSDDEEYSLTWEISDVTPDAGPTLTASAADTVREWIDRMDERLAALRAALPSS